MHTIYSPLKPDAWKEKLKENFSSPLYVFDERVTGIILGPFFSVAHYQEYEWNRRITSECSRAWGFVKEADGQSEITFLRGWGCFSPGWILFYTLLCRAVFLYLSYQDNLELGMSGWVISLGISVFCCAISILHDSLTEGGQASWRQLKKCLEDPENYY